jgi:hypothetical protein
MFWSTGIRRPLRVIRGGVPVVKVAPGGCAGMRRRVWPGWRTGRIGLRGARIGWIRRSSAWFFRTASLVSPRWLPRPVSRSWWWWWWRRRRSQRSDRCAAAEPARTASQDRRVPPRAPPDLHRAPPPGRRSVCHVWQRLGRSGVRTPVRAHQRQRQIEGAPPRQASPGVPRLRRPHPPLHPRVEQALIRHIGAGP